MTWIIIAVGVLVIIAYREHTDKIKDVKERITELEETIKDLEGRLDDLEEKLGINDEEYLDGDGYDPKDAEIK